jgi:hypothetical protein
MAIQMTGVTNRHLYSVSTNFRSPVNPYSITVWINAVWNGGTRLSFVGMYDGGLTTPVPTVGLQIGTSGTVVGAVDCWTYGGASIVTSAAAAMTAFNNIWTMVTYTYDGASNRVYRNNTLLATSATAPVADSIFTQIYINGYPPTGTTSETATYQVDSYAYYGRTLSLDEITTIYNAQGTRHGITDGLLARFDFDELAQGATVTGVVDVSGNGNTLLNSGAGNAITYTYSNAAVSSNLRMVQ